MAIPFAKSNFRKGSDALPGVAANQQVSPTFIGNYFWQPLYPSSTRDLGACREASLVTRVGRLNCRRPACFQNRMNVTIETEHD